MKMKTVFSTHIAQVGYDTDKSQLHVVFKDGKHAVYKGITPKTADSVLHAPSIGLALNEFVKKPGHLFEYLGELNAKKP